VEEGQGVRSNRFTGAADMLISSTDLVDTGYIVPLITVKTGSVLSDVFCGNSRELFAGRNSRNTQLNPWAI
jgi:hypothetical protein